MMFERLSSTAPPHNLAAERALLGAILLDNRHMDATGRLNPADFFEVKHGRMFSAMRELRDTGAEINLLTLRPAIVIAAGERSEGVLAAYLKELFAVGAVTNIEAVAAEIVDYAARRRLCTIAEEMTIGARSLELDIRNTASIALDAMDEAIAMARPRDPTRGTIGDAMADLMNRLVDGKPDTAKIPTGLSSLDEVIGGWRRKQLTLIAGRPSMGKTTIITSAMLGTAKRGHGVLMFSLEMTKADLAARCLTDIAWKSDQRIPYASAMNGWLKEHELRALGTAAAHRAKLPLVIDDQRGLTMAEIGGRIRAERQRMERDGGVLGLVIVDHLGLIKPSGRYAGNRVQEVGEISDGLATLAKDNDVALVALQQLNRGTESRENKRPTLADLRDSGNLEQDADVVCFTFRQSYYLERMKADAGSATEQTRQEELEQCRNVMEFMIAKNRNGPTTTVDLFCDMPSNVVRDLSR